MITPLPGAWSTPEGCATLPFFGVAPVMLDDKGRELQGPGEGILAVKAPWPGMFRSIWGDKERFEQAYFSAFKVCESGGLVWETAACGRLGHRGRWCVCCTWQWQWRAAAYLFICLFI
jgi:acyl-coenzyme A synthetase/AMP-(fatty) acid ligase